jgi:septal ring factor EnvC (AmiA/AmiB activator)
MVRYYMIEEELRKNEILLSDVMNKRDCCIMLLVETKKTLNDLERIRQEQLKDLENSNERIGNETKKKIELEKKIDELDLKSKTTKKIIENTTTIAAIVVDDEEKYNSGNGLVSINRDIVMKLLKIIRDEMKIRNVY